MKEYQILLNEKTFSQIKSYFELLKWNKSRPGERLKKAISDLDLNSIKIEDFIKLLINTKKTRIFAESEVIGDGSDWNETELSILGDINISVPVTVYDNGLHANPAVHTEPFGATLIYVPGALLENMRGGKPADWDEVVSDNRLDLEKFYELYERRLFAPFMYINDVAKKNNELALVTVPGLGCGQFAGKFSGLLGSCLRDVLISFLKKHSELFSCIKVVYFDPYDECSDERIKIDHISFFTRPLLKGNQHKPQLCRPVEYEDECDDFSRCRLFSLVAWDHVSWPGNDFYAGTRATDDGVKAAATDSMFRITGVEGVYDFENFMYSPPIGFETWEDVVLGKGIEIEGKLLVF